MHSTVQQTVYLLPTARRAAHPSQARFDPTVSLKVRSIAKCTSQPTGDWGYGRTCWTADVSRCSQQHKLSPPRTTTVNPETIGRRAHTTLTLPTTASLPKKGQVKLTSLHDQNQQKSQTKEESRGRVLKRHRTELGRVPAATNIDSTQETSIRGLTIADIQSAIDVEFPETQGLAFNRASHYLRTATAELIRCHSRLSGEAPLSRGQLPQSEQSDGSVVRPQEKLVASERIKEEELPTNVWSATAQSNTDVGQTAPVNIHVPTS